MVDHPYHGHTKQPPDKSHTFATTERARFYVPPNAGTQDGWTKMAGRAGPPSRHLRTQCTGPGAAVSLLADQPSDDLPSKIPHVVQLPSWGRGGLPW